MSDRAAVLEGVQQLFRILPIELDTPRPDEVVVRLAASGVCHSDWHIVTGDMAAPFPYVCGHEGAGVVEAVGASVTRVHPGDHVVFAFMPSCGVCRWCSSGKTNLCDLGAINRSGARRDGSTRLRDDTGRPLRQFCQISTFAERTLVAEGSIVKIDPDLPLHRACLVGCGVPTGMGAAINRARVRPGSSVVVVGCGGIGMNVIQGARLAGAALIVGVDRLDFKLEQARRFGATHTVNAAREDVPARVRELTNGVGADYTFEAIGTPVTFGLAFACAGKGSTTVLIGVAPERSETIPVNPFELVLYQKALLGTLYGTCNPRTDIPRLLDLYRAGRLMLDELVTCEYRLDQINEAFADLLAGRVVRGVIRYD